MNGDQTFRFVLMGGAIIFFPIALYYRIRSQATREKLDRRQEGAFILLTLRPIGLATIAGLITYLINPSRMAWSSLPLPVWMRWLGVAMAVVGGASIVWAFSNLGRNLTDTVVTRRAHTLVVTGPYRWVRHPFYLAVLFIVLGNGLAAANWFLLLGGTLVFVLMVIRTRTEEAKLIERFGDQYRAYMARTGRFLPKIGHGGRLS